MLSKDKGVTAPEAADTANKTTALGSDVQQQQPKTLVKQATTGTKNLCGTMMPQEMLDVFHIFPVTPLRTPQVSTTPSSINVTSSVYGNMFAIFFLPISRFLTV
jgi:hypothetical protein